MSDYRIRLPPGTTRREVLQIQAAIYGAIGGFVMFWAVWALVAGEFGWPVAVAIVVLGLICLLPTAWALWRLRALSANRLDESVVVETAADRLTRELWNQTRRKQGRPKR